MSLPRHHRPAAAVGAGLIAVLALGACSASGSTGSSAGAGVSAVAPANPDLGGAPDAAPDAAADAQKLAESSGQGAAAGSPGSGTAARNASPSSAADVAAADKLVRTASLQVQVDDVEAKAAEARQVALAAGGTVVSENSSAVPVSSGGVDKQGSRSTMSLSVPADTLDRVLDDLGKLGTTVQRSSSARDVTSTYVDTQSRITTMKASLDQLRTLLGNVISYDRVWRTGANAATQFTSSSPITLAGLSLPAGTYTLWTAPHVRGVDLIVNRQTGQWGTEYSRAQDVGTAPMKSDSVGTPVEKFTISIEASDTRHGTLAMAWGTFRWTAPIVVQEMGR